MNLYEILGIKRNAPAAAVRAAYLKKAKRMHPDQGGDAEAFKEIARAYGVLGDPSKRIAYDQTGKEDAGPTVEDAAVAIVRNLLEMVIASNFDPVRTNVIAEMRAKIDEAIMNSNNHEAEITRKIVRCKTLIERFNVKAGDNLIAKMVQGRIDEMDRQVAAIDRDRANFEAAKELLSSYDYKFEATPTHLHPSMIYAQAMAQNTQSAMGGFWR